MKKVISLVVISVLAAGGRAGLSQTSSTAVNVCDVSDCNQSSEHMHEVCPQNECTMTVSHDHEGDWYYGHHGEDGHKHDRATGHNQGNNRGNGKEHRGRHH